MLLLLSSPTSAPTAVLNAFRNRVQNQELLDSHDIGKVLCIQSLPKGDAEAAQKGFIPTKTEYFAPTDLETC